MIDRTSFNKLRPQAIFRDCEAEDAFIPEEDESQISNLLGGKLCILPSVMAEFQYAKTPPFPLARLESFIPQGRRTTDDEALELERLYEGLGINPAACFEGSGLASLSCYLLFQNLRDNSQILIFVMNQLEWSLFNSPGSDLYGVLVRDLILLNRVDSGQQVDTLTLGELDVKQLVVGRYRESAFLFLKCGEYSLLAQKDFDEFRM